MTARPLPRDGIGNPSVAALPDAALPDNALPDNALPDNALPDNASPDNEGRTRWTFLSNHAHVLVCLARDPEMRLRDIGDHVGITERAASSIVGELEEEGYLTRSRVGRRNAYELHLEARLRHPLEADHNIGELIDTLRTRRKG